MDFQPAKKNMHLFRAPIYGVYVFLLCFIWEVAMEKYVVLLFSQILNSTSDPRQSGHSSPFTTISSQKGHGMRNSVGLLLSLIARSPLSWDISANICCCLRVVHFLVHCPCFSQTPHNECLPTSIVICFCLSI